MLCLYLIWRLILIYFNPSSPASDSFPSTVGKKKSKIRCYSTGESEVVQSCPTLCDPMDYSPPGFSIHGIFQARILEWVAISFSRRSSSPRDQTRVSRIVGRCFIVWTTREVKHRYTSLYKNIVFLLSKYSVVECLDHMEDVNSQTIFWSCTFLYSNSKGEIRLTQIFVNIWCG